MHIHIIEDEEKFAKLIAKGLANNGYDVSVSSTGEAGIVAIKSGRSVDLLLLDRMLPDIDGEEICKNLKKSHPDLPIIMLTALAESEDVVFGLDCGADDYLTKPVIFEELLARIRSVARRFGKRSSNFIEIGEITISMRTREVWVRDRKIDLTKKEFEIISYLITSKGEVKSRSQIINAVWGYNAEIYDKTLDSHIKNIRKKIDVNTNFIQSIRGIGYKIS